MGIFALLVGLTCLGNAMQAADANAAPIACHLIARTIAVATGHPCRVTGTMLPHAPANLRP